MKDHTKKAKSKQITINTLKYSISLDVVCLRVYPSTTGMITDHYAFVAGLLDIFTIEDAPITEVLSYHIQIIMHSQ